LTIVFSILLEQNIFSQPKYYWNENYGTRSNLLVGQVIGSVDNITAVYYNPGFLGLVEDAQLIIGAKVFEYNEYKIKFDDKRVSEFSSGQFSPSPGFIGGSFSIDSSRIHKFFYSVLVRELQEFTFNSNIVNNDANSEFGSASSTNILYNSDLSETWLGLSWAFSPIDNLGIGVSTFFAIRNDDERDETIFNTIDNSGNVKINQYLFQNSYYNVRALFKLGLYWRDKNFTLGLNLTTPSLNLFGSGESYFNIALSSNHDREGILISNYQEDLESIYKNSYSIGAGASYIIGPSKIHISFEYFNNVQNYDILAPKAFQSQSFPDSLEYSWNNGLSSVINFGIGYELYITDKWSIYGSLFLERNANEEESEFNSIVFNMPIYHATTGLSITIGRVDLTAGLECVYGAQDFSTKLLGGELSELNQDFTGSVKFIKVKGIFSASIDF